MRDSTLVELRILGSLQLRAADGRQVETLVRHAKRTALLAYLAAATPRGPHRRDTLLALFWPESDAPHARAALNQALYVLRSALGEEAIAPRGDGEVGLSSEVVWCDAAAFEAALDAGRPGDALALYRGDLLAGFFVTGAPEFERWLERERARLRERASRGAWALAEERAAAGDTGEAARWARRAADLVPADETMARRLMTFFSKLGDRAAAIRAYDAFVTGLAEEYELEPSAETRALAEAIRHDASVSPALRAARPPLASQPPGDGSGSERPTGRVRMLPRLLGAAALVVAVGVGVAMQRSAVHTPSGGPRILVLPLQNLGAPGDAYFADGITDEITTRLATVHSLQVIGGQSALHYRGTDKTPRQIAAEIGADYVLEGTVSWQRSPRGGGRVRVRPQLINTHDETQVWAAVLDEDVTDLFPMLSRVAQNVVDQLHVALQVPPRSRLGAVPTTSLKAYDYYLRGRVFAKRTSSASNVRAAIEMLERAVEQDSGFALAYAWLAFAHTEAFWLHSMGPSHVNQAERAAVRALRLDPESPDAHMALGHFYYACCEDYRRALSHLEMSEARRPGDAQVVLFIGNVHKRQGRWNDARRYYERAAALDPRSVWPLLNLAQLSLWLRRYDEAERESKEALSLEPGEAFAYEVWASTRVLQDGDIPEARRILAEAVNVSDGFEGMRLPFDLELWDRKYSAALARVGGKLGALDNGDEWLTNDHIRSAVAFRLLGDSAAARAHYDSARADLEEQAPHAYPRSRGMQNWLRSALAISYAGLGRRGAAIEQAALVLDTDPVAVDAISGPATLQNLALAYVLLGEKITALAILERLVSIPARISPSVLRLDPSWDPLRGDPRFERLVRVGR